MKEHALLVACAVSLLSLSAGIYQTLRFITSRLIFTDAALTGIIRQKQGLRNKA